MFNTLGGKRVQKKAGPFRGPANSADAPLLRGVMILSEFPARVKHYVSAVIPCDAHQGVELPLGVSDEIVWKLVEVLDVRRITLACGCSWRSRSLHRQEDTRRPNIAQTSRFVAKKPKVAKVQDHTREGASRSAERDFMLRQGKLPF